MSFKLPFFVIGIASVLSGCTTVPSLPEATGGIPVTEIVLRTKCELASAFYDERADVWLPDTPRYRWLETWTSQVDLTLQVVDSATFSPGASILQPLKNGYGVTAGASTLGGSTISAIPQSFAVAAGVNYNGQAMRTEQLTYNFSVEELKRWHNRTAKSDVCDPSDKSDLSGRLGLKEWVQEALRPVALERDGDTGLLFAGYHPKPVVSTTPQKATTSRNIDLKTFELSKEAPCPKAQTKAQTFQEKIDSLIRASDNTIDDLDLLKSDLKSLRNNVSSAQQDIRNRAISYSAVLDPYVARKDDQEISKLRDLREDTSAFVSKMTRAGQQQASSVTNEKQYLQDVVKDVNQMAATASKAPEKCDAFVAKIDERVEGTQTRLTALQGAENDAEKDLQSARDKLATANLSIDRAAKATKALPPIDPPIASLGQSVQFLLDMGANATPTWTFVRFKGPNSPLASVDRTRTHLLLITIGPSASKTGSGGLDQGPKQAQTNLLLTTLLPYGLGLGR